MSLRKGLTGFSMVKKNKYFHLLFLCVKYVETCENVSHSTIWKLFSVDVYTVGMP